jgi:hypothetical protein
MNNKIILRISLAALPVLGLALQTHTAFLLGAQVTFLLLIAAFIFIWFRRFLPQISHSLIFLSLILALGISSGIPARALIPIFLLLPPEFFKSKRIWSPALKDILIASLAFWVLLAGHGALAQFGGAFFKLPSGSFLYLGVLNLLGRKK